MAAERLDGHPKVPTISKPGQESLPPDGLYTDP